MTLITGILISSMVAALCQSNLWRGITPLRSSRADVEKLLGPPTPDSKAQYAAEYMTENERVLALYSAGTCGAEDYGWNVPRGTVVIISVYPEVKPEVAGLNLDRSKYEEIRDPEVLDVVYYTSEEDGVSLETRKGLVTNFRYGPAAKESHLRCPEPEKPSHD